MVEEDQTVRCPPEQGGCGSRKLETDQDRGEIVCLDCGLVLDDNMVDMGAEWRVFSPEQGDKLSRTGAPMTVLLHDKGLSTDIDWQNKDYSGKAINSRYRSQFYRMRKWQKRARVSNAMERNLSIALAELERVGSRMELPKSVREEAAVIYRSAMNEGLVRGRSIDGVAAAALYGACRKCDVPRTLDEISYASRTGRKEIGRTFRLMARKLNLRLAVPAPESYLDRFCSELGLPPTTLAKAHALTVEAHEKELTSGRGPTGVAAAIIYISSIVTGHRRTQREVADVSGVTEVTIRNRYKEIATKLNIDVDV